MGSFRKYETIEIITSSHLEEGDLEALLQCGNRKRKDPNENLRGEK